ncbi:MAG: RNA pseudouridine synthase, partial [Clostridia bacterium]|nr:RNA pseudouridine synthase [Clostridia bacterium]
MNKVQIVVEQAGERLDKLLSTQLDDTTRSAAQKLIEAGNVTCGAKVLGKN